MHANNPRLKNKAIQDFLTDLLTTLTPFEMFGLVQTITYIMLPIALA